MTKEQEFYKTLKNLFIGARVEGESGYINLMRIKARYFEEEIYSRLQKEIEERLQPFPDFREEFFEKLYDFFHRYFNENGSIHFRSDSPDIDLYERIHSDEHDVRLFWKTQMLYYVKTDRLFKSMKVEINGWQFYFDASTLEHKKANEKRALIFRFKKKQPDGTLVFVVSYSERGRKTNVREILATLQKAGVDMDEASLIRAFRVFHRQKEVDYFINKNVRKFLKEQFDSWFYQYVFTQERNWTEERVAQLKVLKDVSYEIIEFIARFEDELIKIWNKPKFVLRSNYVISLDRIAERNIELLERLLAHPYFDLQLNEWRQLQLIEDDFDKAEIIKQDLGGKYLNPKYQFLPLDTRFFKDLEKDILALFENLDGALDGWLVKSDNYQALNTILPKFRGKIKTIYIDPPFNKEQDADYFYSVKYKDASWITMLENRLKLAREMLGEKGSIFVRCDYNGNMYVRLLMNEIFGEENFRNEIAIRRFKKNVMEKEIKKLPEGLDTIFVYSAGQKFAYIRPFKPRKSTRAGFWRHMGDSTGQGTAKIFYGKVLEPPAGKHWKYSQKRIDQMIAKEKLILVCKHCGFVHDKHQGQWQKCPRCGQDEPVPRYWVEPQDQEVLDSNWSDVYGYSTSWKFQTENSEVLLKRIIEITTESGDLVMDFFLGSGTTTAVAHKLKRKWLGIELGDHFYSVILPRMKKVLMYDKGGISRQKDVKVFYNAQNAGGFFKYYELEQYEDTLRKTVYFKDLKESPTFQEDICNQYIFLRDMSIIDSQRINSESDQIFLNLDKLYSNIDLPETLSNLMGKNISRVDSNYVEFQDGTRIDLKRMDSRLVKPLIYW